MSEANGDNSGRRNVFFLGMVSMFTDLSSQMIYPLVPLFLAGLGVSKTMIGVIEGIAESTASLLRTVFGALSDRAGKRKTFIYLGYGLSAVSKPFLFLARSWLPVLAVRFSDRVGKAIRTPARDALISTSAKKKGKAFGFHRAMDRLGCVGGCVLAYVVLRLLRGRDDLDGMRLVFLFAFIPAILALAFVPFAREVAAVAKGKAERKSGLRSTAFIMFLVASIIFTLGNSSNAFPLLKAKREMGFSIEMIPLIWLFYNAICTIASPIFGSLSDKIGRAPVIMASFIYYAAVYVLFGLADQTWHMWALFGAYGIHYGLSDGIFRAYVADLVKPEYRATAYGILNTGTGVAIIPASVIFGAIWDATDTSKWAFIASAGFSLLGFLVFLVSLLVKGRRPAEE